jgi:mRNA-degrading endonuclease RelE of RelBE toxin-antitoxin system
MGLPSDLPDNVFLLPSASNDLGRILKRNRQEFDRIWDDLKRLGFGTLPPQGKKKLHSVDAFQFDSGRYRVVYSRRDASYVIWAVFAKPDQRDYLRRFRL